MSDVRKQQLADWLSTSLAIEPPKLTEVSGDASFRRYFRFTHHDQSLIAVDSPPDTQKNATFVQIAKLLGEHEVNVPICLKYSLEEGFLLLTDLGDQLLLPLLTQSNVATALYAKAIASMLRIQQIPQQQISQLQRYDAEFLMMELELFNHWFVDQYLEINLTPTQQTTIQQAFQLLVDSALAQSQVMVHRDFHSRNLMLLDNEQIAVIDFQDAVIGPISYDLVSLLKDCYIQWPQTQRRLWLSDYYQQAFKLGLLTDSPENFIASFDKMGLQRHLKVLGIFSRLSIRDNKSGFLKDLTLTFQYVLETAAIYPELSDFHQILSQSIQPVFIHKQAQLQQ